MTHTHISTCLWTCSCIDNCTISLCKSLCMEVSLWLICSTNSTTHTCQRSTIFRTWTWIWPQQKSRSLWTEGERKLHLRESWPTVSIYSITYIWNSTKKLDHGKATHIHISKITPILNSDQIVGHLVSWYWEEMLVTSDAFHSTITYTCATQFWTTTNYLNCITQL